MGKTRVTPANLQEKAIEVANTNPDAGLIYAILDLAQAVRENGCDLEVLAKSHEKLVVEVASVAESITGVSREIVR